MEYLCKLKDAKVIDFETDEFGYGGCETCDYGSMYTNKCVIRTTNYVIDIEVSDMYEYAMSADYWVKFFCKNVLKFEEMTEDEFIDFTKKKLEDSFGNLHYSIQFDVEQRGD